MSKFVWNTLKLVGGAGIAQVATILLSPWLTRIYSPEDFGVFGVFNSMLSLCVVVISARYEEAIVLPKSRREAVNLLALSMLIPILVTGGLWLFFALAGGWLSALLNTPTLEKYLNWLVLTIFVTGTFYTINYWNVRVKKFEVVAGLNLINSVLSNLSKIGLGLAGLADMGGLVFGNLVGTVIVWFSQIGLFLKNEWKSFRKMVDLKEVRAVASRYKKFPLYSSWSSLLQQLSMQVPSFMLSGLFGPEVNGFYALGFRVLRLPSMMVGEALAKVFFQSASEAWNEGKLGPLVEKLATKLINMGVFPFLLISLTGQEFFSVIFGANWGEAGVYMQILGLWTLAVFISQPMYSLFNVFEKNETALVFSIALLVSRVASIYLGYLWGDARLALMLFSFSGVVAYSWLGAFMLRAAGSDVVRLLHNTSRFTLLYAPLLAEALVFQMIFRDRPLPITINALCLGAIFLTILLRKDPDVRGLLKTIMDKAGLFNHQSPIS